MSDSVKRRRLLSELAGVKAVSHSALSAILRRLDGSTALSLEGGTSRFSIASAVDDLLSHSTVHGKVIQRVEIPLTSGGAFARDLVRPAALISWMCDRSPSFELQLLALYSRNPCSRSAPWTIIAYTDEAAPGALLKADNSRKAHLFYWCFEEFGVEVLSREDAWLFGGLLRSKILNKSVDGGLSTVFKYWMKTFFASGVDLSAGVSWHTRQGPLMIYAVLGTVLGDELALKSLWSVKGSSGSLPCMMWQSVI